MARTPDKVSISPDRMLPSGDPKLGICRTSLVPHEDRIIKVRAPISPVVREPTKKSKVEMFRARLIEVFDQRYSLHCCPVKIRMVGVAES